MKILKTRRGDGVWIGDEVFISIDQGSPHLGIKAPPELEIRWVKRESHRPRENRHHRFGDGGVDGKIAGGVLAIIAAVLLGCGGQPLSQSSIDHSSIGQVEPMRFHEPVHVEEIPTPVPDPVPNAPVITASDIDAWSMIESTPWPQSIDSRDCDPVPLPELPTPLRESGGGGDASFLDDSPTEDTPVITRPRSTHRPPTCTPGEVRNCASPVPISGDSMVAGPATVATEFDPADITLRVAYETYLLPSMRRTKADKTTSSYYTSLGHWEAFHRSAIEETGERGSTTSTPAHAGSKKTYADPPIHQITDELLNEFGEWLMADEPPSPDLSIGTADKVWKNVRAILRRVGPRESGNPKAVGILDRVPTMDPMSDLADESKLDGGDGVADVTDEELSAIYQACEIASWPSQCAALQWRTYLVLLAVVGPRVNDAATLRDEHFRTDAKSPVRRSTRQHEHGWLVYLPTKTKSKKRTRLIVPLPLVVRSHVDALLRQRGGQLFSWRDAKGLQFAQEWQRIVDHAGLSHVQRRHLRSSANLRWSRAGVRDDLGKWVLGHAARDVNESHYTAIEQDLIDAVPRLEIPVAFHSRLAAGPIQTFLF